MKMLEEVVAEIPGQKVFSTSCAKSEFWQIKLNEAIFKLCTFNAPPEDINSLGIWYDIGSCSISEVNAHYL